MRIWILLFSVLLLVFMINMDYTAVNLALETMSKEFNADVPTIQWMMSGYVLAWSAFVIAAGRIADLYGRRRMLLLGTGLFVLASIFTGMSYSATTAIVGRALQGLGGALFTPSLYAAIYSNFPKDKRGFAIGLLGGMAGLGQAVGPSLGGMFIHWISWRWIFFINIPLGLVAISIFLVTLDKEDSTDSLVDFDRLGVLLSGLSLVSFMFALSKGPEWGFASPKIITGFSVSVLAALSFILQQRFVQNPLIPKGFFRNQVFLLCCLLYIVFAYGFVCSMFGVGLYLQNTLGYSAFDAGLIFLSFTLMFGFLSAFGGKLADIFPDRHIVVVGLVLMFISMCLGTFLNAHTSLFQVCATLFMMGLSLGLTFPVLNTLMMSALPEHDLSLGSAVFTMLGLTGNSVGVVLNAIMLVLFGRYYLLHRVSLEQLNLTETQTNTLMHTIASAHYDDRALAIFEKVDHKILLDYLHQAFVYGLAHVMITATGVVAVGLIIATRLYKTKLIAKAINV